jgi:hypothetical protein
MITTVQDLIDSSLRLLGVADQEAGPTVSMREQAFDAFGALVESMHLDSLIQYRHVDEQISLTTAATTWGVGATITTTAPTKVFDARRVSGATETDLRVLTMQEYRSIPDKSITGECESVAFDPSYPQGVLYQYPVGSNTVKVTSLKRWDAYAGLDDELSVPPGYTRYLRHLLAIELSGEYPEFPPPAVSATIVGEMRQQIARQSQVHHNVTHQVGTRGGYNINTG